MKTQEVKKLLYAMSEIDDAYIESALSFTPRVKKPSTKLTFPAMKRVALAMVAFLVMGVSLYYLSDFTEDAPPMIGEATPYQEVGSLQAASSLAGFEMIVPKNQASEYEVAYLVYHGDGIAMIEVNYKAENGTDRGYYIRKAKGNEDISGDYNTYASTDIEKRDGRVITLKGNDGKWSLATWSANGYSYAIGLQNQSMDKETILALVKEIR